MQNLADFQKMSIFKHGTERRVDANTGIQLVSLTGTEPDDGDSFELDFKDFFSAEWEATRAPFIVAELEVTDVSAEGGEILEFGALLVNSSGEIIGEFSRLVRVSGTIPAWLLTELELTRADIDRDGQSVAQAMTAFLKFIGNRPVFFHHREFDVPFLKKAAEIQQQEFLNPMHDTLIIAQLTWPDLGKYSAQSLADHLGVEVDLKTSVGYAKVTLAVLLAAREDAFAGNPLPPGTQISSPVEAAR